MGNLIIVVLKSEVQLGVYVYYIKTKDVFGALHEYTGQVNLIK